MVLQVILCALAAGGLVLVVWCVIGRLLLPFQHALISVYVLRPGDEALEQTVRAYEWLCDAGLMAGTLLVADCAEDGALTALAAQVCTQSRCTQLCSMQELKKRLELET